MAAQQGVPIGGTASPIFSSEPPDSIFRIGGGSPGEADAGGEEFPKPNQFLGKIDEVRIYNRRLSHSRIKELFKDGADEPPSPSLSFHRNLSELGDFLIIHCSGTLVISDRVDGIYLPVPGESHISPYSVNLCGHLGNPTPSCPQYPLLSRCRYFSTPPSHIPITQPAFRRTIAKESETSPARESDGGGCRGLRLQL